MIDAAFGLLLLLLLLAEKVLRFNVADVAASAAEAFATTLNPDVGREVDLLGTEVTIGGGGGETSLVAIEEVALFSRGGEMDLSFGGSKADFSGLGGRELVVSSGFDAFVGVVFGEAEVRGEVSGRGDGGLGSVNGEGLLLTLVGLV